MFLLSIYYILYIFFFFQAEDGIRDVAVTGVQTCALPISVDRKILRILGTDGRASYQAIADEVGLSRPAVMERVKRLEESGRSEEHTSELQSRLHLVCRLLLEKKKKEHV